jgi:hypothetical protein
MPWISRPSRRAQTRLREGLRRWRYDNSQRLTAFWIGVAVVIAAGLTAAAVLMS